MRGEDGAGSAISTKHSSDAFKIAAATMGLRLPAAGDAAGAAQSDAYLPWQQTEPGLHLFFFVTLIIVHV